MNSFNCLLVYLYIVSSVIMIDAYTFLPMKLVHYFAFLHVNATKEALVAYMIFTEAPIFVIVIPWVVRLYVEIIHELKRVDYLTYRWTNMV